jgi:hypothetical protein
LKRTRTISCLTSPRSFNRNPRELQSWTGKQIIVACALLTSLTLKLTCAFQEDYDDIVNGWKAKLQRSSAGEQRWGLFIATK